MVKHLFKILVLLVLVGAFTIIVVTFQKKADRKGSVPLPIFASETPLPAAITNVVSPDGKVTLTMREKRVEAGTSYTISVSGQEIFSKTLPLDSKILIPFNTFSPDNKYIFLKENTLGKVDYFTLPLSGGAAIDVSGPFEEKFAEDYVISDVTGWGGVNLLVIRTQGVDGANGPTFWFEVPGGALIRLSHNF